MDNLEESNYPTVSILTPTFDRKRFLPLIARCIELQNYPMEKLEWIIVNDGEEEIKDTLIELRKTKKLPNIRYYKYDYRMKIGAKRNILNMLKKK